MPPDVSAALHIRLAEPRDAPRLVDLVNSVYRGDSSRQGWTTEADLLDGQRTDLASLQEFLSRGSDRSLMLVGETDQRLIACVQLERHGQEAHLGMLSVNAQEQAQGIGRQMIAAAERGVIEHWRATTLALSVIHLRQELIAWYQRRGFLPTEERSEFPYGDTRFGLPKREDLWFVTLRKSLTSS